MAQLSDDCFAFGGALLTVDAARALIAAQVRAVEGVDSGRHGVTAGAQAGYPCGGRTRGRMAKCTPTPLWTPATTGERWPGRTERYSITTFAEEEVGVVDGQAQAPQAGRLASGTARSRVAAGPLARGPVRTPLRWCCCRRDLTRRFERETARGPCWSGAASLRWRRRAGEREGTTSTRGITDAFRH